MKMSDVLDLLDDADAFEFLYKGNKVKLLNEAGRITQDSRFFAAGFEYGAQVLVHVESYGRDSGYEGAYEAWIDSLPEIEATELPEAYFSPPEGDSFHDVAWNEMRPNCPDNIFSDEGRAYVAKIHDRAKQLMDRAFEDARNEQGLWPQLVEGYAEDSSCKVKDLGHYAWMSEADLDDIEIVRVETAEKVA